MLTSVGVGHARRRLCRRLRHCRLPTAVSPSSCRRRCIAGLDRHAFRRANIRRRCTRWNLLLLHLRERAPHCVPLRPASPASTSIAGDWACCSSRSRCIRSAPSGSRSSKKRPQQASTRARIFGGLPPGFAALRPRSGASANVLQLLCTLLALGSGLPTSCAACGSPQRRQSEAHCGPKSECQLGQHSCSSLQCKVRQTPTT